MNKNVNRVPSKPQTGKAACLLVLLGLLVLALAAIGVVNWKVGRGVPDTRVSTAVGVHEGR